MKYKVEDTLEKILDYRGKTPKKSNNGIPVISAKCIKNGRIDYSSCYFISSGEYGKFMTRGFPRKGDIILTTEAPLGNVAKLNREDIGVAQRVLTLRGKAGVLDNDYLLYFLKSGEGQNLLKSRESGTTVTGIKQSEFRKLEIDLPPISIQKRMVKILLLLDQKIDINTRINKNLLEQLHLMVSEVYRNPSFELKPISVIADVIDCLHSKKPYPVEDGYGQLIQLDNIRDDGFLDMRNSTYFISKPDFENWTRKLIISPGDFVITNVGRVGAVAMAPAGTKAAMGRNMTAIRLKHDSQYYSYFFAVMTSKEMRREIRQRTDVGTIMNALNVKDIPNLRIPISSEQQMRGIEKTFKSFVEQIEANNLENQFLSAVRDSLLPKLLSGTIELS